MKNKFRKIRSVLKYYFDYHILLFLFFFFTIFVIVLTIVLVNTSEFNSVLGAIWWLIISLITTEPGYADMYPKTTLGYLVQILIILLGLGILGTFVAKLTDTFNVNTQKKELGNVSVPFDDHLIICGWSEKTKSIVKEILDEPKREYKYIVLVAELDKDPYVEKKEIVFVRGKIDDVEALERANVKGAKRIIILNEDNNDSTTVLAALIIHELNKDIYSIAEVSNGNNVKYFEAAGVTQTIVNNDFSSNLLVRTALYEDTALIIKELLTNSMGNEIYINDIERNDIGKTFLELMNKYKSNKKDITLIGVKTHSEDGESKIITNPDKDYIIRKDDKIIYIGKNDKGLELLFFKNYI